MRLGCRIRGGSTSVTVFRGTLERLNRKLRPEPRPLRWFLPAVLALGFLARLPPACRNYLNPDEAMHYLLAVEPSFAATYQASKAVTHPPLLILVLHCWRILGQSEGWLRLPGILASIGFCWLMFAWVRRVVGESAARMTLLLLAFAPSLIFLSAEIRQYAWLWLFCAASLYFLDEALIADSWRLMLASALALQLALLSHYSAFLVALVLGVYALLRLFSAKSRRAVWLAWLAGQAAGIGLSDFLLETHVRQLKQSGLAETIAETYLRKSIYHPGDESLSLFVVRSNLRLFHYFFSQGAVGIGIALAMFIVGIVILARNRQAPPLGYPNDRQLAFLMALPFIINCALAVAAVYPYGGTRHDSYLALFAMPAIAVGTGYWRPSAETFKIAVVVAVLIVCNLFRTPMGEFIPWQAQKRQHMLDAMAALRQLPQNSIILADAQGAMALSYYLCDAKVAQFFPPYQPFAEAGCGPYRVISIDPDRWLFKAESLAADLQTVQRMFALPTGARLWVFQAGWEVDKNERIDAELRRDGCPSPRKFGANISLCPILLN